MDPVIDVLLLCALPASGKSETRKYLDTLSDAECRSGFHLGKTVQLDDYPYVHCMRRVDDELIKLGHAGVFFRAPDKNFSEPKDWGTLIKLLNEDYRDLVSMRRPAPEHAGIWLIERLQEARKGVGAVPLPDSFPKEAVADGIAKDAEKLLADKNKEIPESLEGKTIVIEFARGGKEGSEMPLPFGYE